jgi:lipid A ethanolaminephosphotransferase
MSAIATAPRFPFAQVRRTLAALANARPWLGTEALVLLSSLYMTLASNRAFFRAAADAGVPGPGGGWGTVACLFVAITALHALLLGAFGHRRILQPLLAVLLLANAAAAHFMDAFGVYFDADMLRNILHTDFKESQELLSWSMLVHVLAYGVVPAIAVGRVRLRPRPLPQALLHRGGLLLGTMLLAAAAILASFQASSALMRNHHELRFLITPGNYLVSLVKVAAGPGRSRHAPRTPVGARATLAPRAAGARPRLLVLVVGETVRAQNWGLGGYARATTPELARIAPINFLQVQACGSSTEVSLPCMFSPWGRGQYARERIESSQSLLHVLDHAGVATLWRDNQTGCKGVCEGLPFESFEHARVPGPCTDEGCLDEVLLDGLDARLQASPGDTVIVLHQLGNHGPAYFRRYPRRLRRFTPACETDDLSRCTQQEIVNAYDNAVLYTDEFLARTIGWLARRRDRDAALIYVSDHGESLGDHGLYLHGVPYAIAPQEQLHVPMVAWLSPGFAHARGIDLACMRARSDAPASHDNLFHSVLGLMQVRTPEYRPSLDLFAPCAHAEAGPAAQTAKQGKPAAPARG